MVKSLVERVCLVDQEEVKEHIVVTGRGIVVHPAVSYKNKYCMACRLSDVQLVKVSCTCTLLRKQFEG